VSAESHAGLDQLIDAAIGHLEDLRAHGVRFVPVHANTWAALNQSCSRPPAPSRRAPLPSAAMPRSAPPPTPPPAPKPPANKPGLGQNPLDRPALSPAGKESALEALRARVLPCRKCEHLASSRRTVVFGTGSACAELMFVGEAPGADEDAQGIPFVGKAGQLLTRIIETMGLSRETVYIGNILKCRPDTPGQSSGNRKPTPIEMATCLPHLLAQIDIIQPKVLVALGGTAVEGLMGKMEGITKLRGRWLEFHGIPLMPTYHPAYLLRNQALAEKRKVWEDMLEVMARLGLPISQKQRSFFLRGT